MKTIKVLFLGFLGLLLPNCAAQVSLNPSESAGSGWGLAGSPTTTTISSGGSSGSAIVVSETGALTVFVRTSASTFSGGVSGANVQASDPFLESGMEQVLFRVTE